MGARVCVQTASAQLWGRPSALPAPRPARAARACVPPWGSDSSHHCTSRAAATSCAAQAAATTSSVSNGGRGQGYGRWPQPGGRNGRVAESRQSNQRKDGGSRSKSSQPFRREREEQQRCGQKGQPQRKGRWLAGTFSRYSQAAILVVSMWFRGQFCIQLSMLQVQSITPADPTWPPTQCHSQGQGAGPQPRHLRGNRGHLALVRMPPRKHRWRLGPQGLQHQPR